MKKQYVFETKFIWFYPTRIVPKTRSFFLLLGCWFRRYWWPRTFCTFFCFRTSRWSGGHRYHNHWTNTLLLLFSYRHIAIFDNGEHGITNSPYLQILVWNIGMERKQTIVVISLRIQLYQGCWNPPRRVGDIAARVFPDATSSSISTISRNLQNNAVFWSSEYNFSIRLGFSFNWFDMPVRASAIVEELVCEAPGFKVTGSHLN